jgi:hypothetical protein
LTSKGQTKVNFEGRINYEIKYQLKDSIAFEYLGNVANVYIKNGNYRQDYPNSTYIRKLIYNQESNSCYYLLVEKNQILKYDYSNLGDTLINISKSDVITDVLNIKCKSITFKFKKSTITYFYNSSYSINPVDFEKHIYGSYNIYAKETKSIYLKSIISDEFSTITLTAQEINIEKLDDKIFNLEE